MGRELAAIIIVLLSVSMFSVLRFNPASVKAQDPSSDLLSLPTEPYGWQYSDSSHNALMENPLAGHLISVSGQSISASPGQTVSISVTYQVFAQMPPNNPSEIDQLFFVESWTTSWPPQGYTIPLYNGIHGLSPGVTQTNTISFTVPTVSGTYYLWLCFEAQYSMQDAVNQRTASMNGLPAHIKIVVSAPAAYLTDIVQLTTNPYRDWQPIWSKDGSKIVYFAYDNDWDRHIWIMNADGTGKMQLTFGNVLDESGDFSPDGKEIVFIRYAIDRGIDGFDLWTMNSDGSNLQRLTSTGLHHGLPRWSHDGQKLAFYYGGAGTNTNEIHIMNADGTNEVTVVSSSYSGMSASWSLDDRKLVYTMDDGIWLVNTFPPYDKTHLYRTSLPANQVAFSPDGKYILYSSGVLGQLQDLYLIDSNGNFVAQLTNDAKIGYPFDWSPDGQYIAFGSLKSGNADVWRARIVTDSGLVGYWKFDEGSGNTAYDSSGNGNSGYLINNPQWVMGVSGSALGFDGQSSYVNVPDSQSLRPSGDEVSVELWFKPTVTLDSNTPATLFIDKGNSYAFWINMPPQQPTPNGKIGFIVSTDSPYYNGHWIESTTNQWLAGTWYHIVGTYDGSSLKIYVNGNLENSVALTGTYLTSDSYSLAIGAYDMAAGWRPWFFNGAVDEVKIYNYARTAEEIQNDYASLSQPSFTISITPDYATVSLNQQLTFTGTVQDGNGNPVTNALVSVDDPIASLCASTTTDSHGSFSYTMTATRFGAFLFAFYHDSATKTAIVDVGLQATFSRFPELKIRDVGTVPVEAILSVDGTEQGRIIVNPSETSELIKVNEFKPEIVPGFDYCPVPGGGLQMCIDNEGIMSVEGGEVWRLGGYAKLSDTVFGLCAGVGGGLPFGIEGEGLLCIGSDGITLEGSAGPSIAQGKVEIKIVRFEQTPAPTMMLYSHSPISLKVTDPAGNNIGFDPNNGFVDEVYGATYTGPSAEPGVINIPMLLEGRYTFNIFGLADGDYHVKVVSFQGESITSDQWINGTISSNQLFECKVFVNASEIPVVDDTPPSTTLTIGSPNYVGQAGTYVTTGTTYALFADDGAGSGVAYTAYRVVNSTYDSGWMIYNSPFKLTSLGDGIYTFCYNSTDNAGNVEASHAATFIVDNTPPSTNITIGNPQYSTTKSTFVTPNTPFTLSASDGSGSGVTSILYRVSNSTYNSGWLTYSTPFCITTIANGNYTISYYSIDNLGNNEAQHSTYITLFSWTYVFTDSYGRGTVLQICTQYKLFQFTAPNKNFGVKYDPNIIVLKNIIVMCFSDKAMSLVAAGDGKTGACAAVTLDKQTNKLYLLVSKPGPSRGQPNPC